MPPLVPWRLIGCPPIAQLEGKQVMPPYKPKLGTERDFEHFDPQFTSEPVQLTPDDT